MRQMVGYSVVPLLFRWKKVRSIFKQPQTPLKLKAMLPLAVNVAKEMIEYLNKHPMKPLEV